MNACPHGRAGSVVWAVMETEAEGVQTGVKGAFDLLGVAVAVWKCHQGPPAPSQGWLTEDKSVSWRETHRGQECQLGDTQPS